METGPVESMQDQAIATSRRDAVGKRERWIVRAVFLGVLLMLMLQTAFQRQIREPYPALRLPQFSLPTSVYESGELTRASVSVDIQFADGETTSLTPEEWLSHVPLSHHATMMKLNFFSARGERDAEHSAEVVRRSEIKQKYERFLPGLKYRVPLSEPALHPELLREWTIQRANDLNPGEHAVSVTFRWEDERWELSTGQRVDEEASVHTLVITPDRTFEVTDDTTN